MQSYLSLGALCLLALFRWTKAECGCGTGIKYTCVEGNYCLYVDCTAAFVPEAKNCPVGKRVSKDFQNTTDGSNICTEDLNGNQIDCLSIIIPAETKICGGSVPLTQSPCLGTDCVCSSLLGSSSFQCDPSATCSATANTPESCSDNPCQASGACVQTGAVVGCQCPAGHIGAACQINTCICRNDGVCAVEDFKWVCKCPVGWGGELCELATTAPPPTESTTPGLTTMSTTEPPTEEPIEVITCKNPAVRLIAFLLKIPRVCLYDPPGQDSCMLNLHKCSCPYVGCFTPFSCQDGDPYANKPFCNLNYNIGGFNIGNPFG